MSPPTGGFAAVRFRHDVIRFLGKCSWTGTVFRSHPTSVLQTTNVLLLFIRSRAVPAELRMKDRECAAGE